MLEVGFLRKWTRLVIKFYQLSNYKNISSSEDRGYISDKLTALATFGIVSFAVATEGEVDDFFFAVA